MNAISITRRDFVAWIAEVNAEVIRISEFDREAFNDWRYADAFAEGTNPVTAARAALAADSFGRDALALAGIDPEDYE